MKFKSKTFRIIWVVVSIIVAWWFVRQITPQTIILSNRTFDLNDLSQKADCQDPKDPSSCNIVNSPSEAIDVSQLFGQLTSFDNFFPLSAIAKVNFQASSSLESNVYLEVTYPKYSKKISNIEISCAEEDSPRFDSDEPIKKFEGVRPISASAVIFNYFTCERPKVSLFGPSEKIEVGPNESVSFAAQGDRITVTQNRSVLVEFDAVTKVIIFSVIFFLSLVVGNILFVYLINFDLIKQEKTNRSSSVKRHRTGIKSKMFKSNKSVVGNKKTKNT
ncbi:MAG: hypothetical protein Q7R73_04540 [bacterium]|nr:hypothetical protein [bacterium]